jgi:hypothetical protein
MFLPLSHPANSCKREIVEEEADESSMTWSADYAKSFMHNKGGAPKPW